MRPRWPLPLLALCVAGALGSLALHAAWCLGRPPAPLAVPVALELGIGLVWLPAVAVFAFRARRRFGSPFAPALVRAFFPTFFAGTPAWLRRAATGAVAYAALFLFARWIWQLDDPAATWASPADPELTALAFAFYVLSAAVLAGAGRDGGPGPRPL